MTKSPIAFDPSHRAAGFQGERIEQWLRSNSFCLGFSDSSTRALMSGGHCSRHAAGQIIFEQNDPADSMFLIFEGEVTLSAQNLEGREERTLAVLEAGQFFGETAVLDKAGRTARAIAATPCILMQVDSALFYRLLDAETRALARNLLFQANANLRKANEKVVGEVVDSERRQIFRSVVQWLLESKQDALTGMRLNADMLAHSAIQEDLRQVAGHMVTQVEEFIDVFSAMHEYATGSPHPLHAVELDVRTIFLEEEKRLQEMTRPRQVHLDAYAERVEVYLDERLIRQIIRSLFKGVVPLAEPRSLMEFRIGRLGGALEFRMAYDHLGITEFQALRLFEPFVSDGHGGRTGIDLALVRTWSAKLGGKALLQQKAGDRVTLAVVLPLRSAT